jgi:hypothetical protein
MQLEYRHHEGMGVPITWDLLTRSRRPRDDDVFPYIYKGTNEKDYQLADTAEQKMLCYLI